MQRKKLLIAVLAIALLIGTASAALLTYYGKITETATVEQSFKVDDKNWNGSITCTYHGVTGNSIISLHTLRNYAEVPVTVEFATGYTNGTDGHWYNGAGITTSYQKWDTPTKVISGGQRPTVIYDNKLYKMWYKTGSGFIHYAESSDGSNWVNVVNTNVKDVNDCPFVMKEGNTYYMVNYKTGTSDEFYIYTSPDGITWTIGSMLFKGSTGGLIIPGTNDYAKIDNPKILKDGTEYKMYFQVKTYLGGTTTADKYYIYMATSTTIDGTYTIRNGGWPVLSPSTSGWDSFRVMQPMVIKSCDGYLMMYTGYDKTDQHGKIGYAVSDNGISFTKVGISFQGYDEVLGTDAWKTSLVMNENGEFVLFYENDIHGGIDKATLITILDGSSQITLQPKEIQGFFITNYFTPELSPDTYTITTIIKPA